MHIDTNAATPVLTPIATGAQPATLGNQIAALADDTRSVRAGKSAVAHEPESLMGGKTPLTDEQKAGLKRLHGAAQQFESLFVNMLFKSMRAASPQTSITGDKLSPAETTFTEMLDEKRSESMAQTGAFGIGKVLEDQLRESVLANPSQAAKARLAPEGIL